MKECFMASGRKSELWKIFAYFSSSMVCFSSFVRPCEEKNSAMPCAHARTHTSSLEYLLSCLENPPSIFISFPFRLLHVIRVRLKGRIAPSLARSTLLLQQQIGRKDARKGEKDQAHELCFSSQKPGLSSCMLLPFVRGCAFRRCCHVG